MKVLFLLNTLGSGGTESSLAACLPTFLENGVNPLVACFASHLATRDSVFERIIGRYSTIYPIPGNDRFDRVRQTRRLFLEWTPDIIHSSLVEANLVSRVANIGLSSILINSLVSTTYVKARFQVPNTRVFKHRCLQVVDAITGLFLVDHFHAVNQAVKDEAVRSLFIPSDRITVIQRGRPLALFQRNVEKRALIRRELGISEDDFLLCNIGRQSHIKGQIDLLRAFSSAARMAPDLKLIVAGRRGDCSEKLISFIAQNDLADKVFLLGHRDDIPSLLCASDLFIFPSHLEGIGGAAIEAMAAGLPIVASDIPGLRETLGEQHKMNFVPPKTPELLCEAILFFKNRPQLREHQAEANRLRCLQNFQIETNAQRMVELYQDLIHDADKTRTPPS